MKEAKERALLITGPTLRLFKSIRRDISIMGYTELTDSKIKELVSQYVKQALSDIDDIRLSQRLPRTEYQLNDEKQSARYGLAIASEALKHRDIKFVKHLVNGLLESQGIKLDGPEYKKLSYEVLKAAQAVSKYEYKSIMGAAPEDILQPYLKNTQGGLPVPQVVQPEITSEPISAIIEAWWKEASPAWKERTKVEYQRGADRFIEFLMSIGHGPNSQVHTIGYDVLRAYKDFLMRKPKKGRGLSFASVDKYLGVTEALFNWAVRNNHIQNNPSDGLQIGKKATKKRADEQQEIFELGDLQKLFRSEQYLSGSFTHPWQYWLPLLGLFIGARLEELCQLYVDDIKQIEDVWCIDINEGREDQSVKTHERRYVPIHPFLLDDLGFTSRLPKGGRVFPTLNRVNHRYSHYVTKWFSQYRLDVGIKADRGKKTFHSFRHTLATTLALADVPDFIISQVIGHANRGQTTGRYVKRFDPATLLDKAILKLNYVEAIGLEALVSP